MLACSFFSSLLFLGAAEGIETLVRVSDERQAHLGCQILALVRRLCPQRCRVVVLVDLVDREVLRVDVGMKLWLERRPNLAKAVPLHAAEERMLPNLVRTANTAQAVLVVADETSSS